MAKPKKELQDGAAQDESPVPVSSKGQKVLSMRSGAVKCPCGALLEHKKVAEVSADSVAWLRASFPEEQFILV